MHIKHTLQSHPQLRQVLGAGMGALVALAVYHTYQFGAGIVSAHMLSDDASAIVETEVIDVDESVTFARIGEVAREKLRGMEQAESVD